MSNEKGSPLYEATKKQMENLLSAASYGDEDVVELIKFVMEKPNERITALMSAVTTLCIIVPGMHETFNIQVERAKANAYILAEGSSRVN